jgi:hypothetical protein
MTTLLRFFAFCILLAVLPVHAAPIGPSITVDSKSIIGTGFTPGREVVIFGAANVPQPYYARLVDYLQILTVDAAGTIRWTPSEGVPPRSVWFAVDLSSTGYTVAYPGSGSVPVPGLAAPVISAVKDLQSDALSIDEYTVKVLLVRSNDDVWTGSPIRHGSSDVNRGKPGTMDIDVTQLRSVRGNKHLPGHLVPSDLVIMIEPISLRFYVGRSAAH